MRVADDITNYDPHTVSDANYKQLSNLWKMEAGICNDGNAEVTEDGDRIMSLLKLMHPLNELHGNLMFVHDGRNSSIR